MLAVYFAYGLAFFALGGAALLEARQSSKLSLGRQLPWLAAFGITHSLVEWSDIFLMTALAERWRHYVLRPFKIRALGIALIQ